MDAITQIRSFNRSYTQILGLLNQQILNSSLSLTEARIIYELEEKGKSTAKILSADLQIDKGYLSRILKKLIKENYILAKPSISDKRSQDLSLSSQGKEIFAQLDQASQQQIFQLLTQMNPYEKNRFISSLGQAQRILENGKQKVALEEISIRNDFQPGDIGFVIQSHGELYFQEHDFGPDFEKYVTLSFAEFFSLKQPNKSKAWICEHNHNKIGFLMLVDRGEAAQLRYFFIYPEYRGIGLGSRLMHIFMEYLRQQAFKSCYLFTSKHLDPAKNLYLKYGFELVEEKESYNMGAQMIEQKYILEL